MTNDYPWECSSCGASTNIKLEGGGWLCIKCGRREKLQ